MTLATHSLETQSAASTNLFNIKTLGGGSILISWLLLENKQSQNSLCHRQTI